MKALLMSTEADPTSSVSLVASMVSANMPSSSYGGIALRIV